MFGLELETIIIIITAIIGAGVLCAFVALAIERKTPDDPMQQVVGDAPHIDVRR